MNEVEDFEKSKIENIRKQGGDENVRGVTKQWFNATYPHRYSYNFTWLGRPIIQYPQDVVAMQEIIFSTKPDLIIETGIAHGGSLILSASMLELVGGNGQVIGIDIDIRAHNRAAIEAHPMAKRIKMIQASSVADEAVGEVRKLAASASSVMVILDSNHTHEHVARELELYSSLVTKGSYLIVFDTIVEDMPPDAFPDRPWGIGNNPKTAVHEFLKTNKRFEIDRSIQDKLLITVAPDGYLRCVGG